MKNIHAVKQTCLAEYLQEYLFLDEAHKKYLESKFSLGDSLLVIHRASDGLSDEIREIQERLESAGRCANCDIYCVVQGSMALTGRFQYHRAGSLPELKQFPPYMRTSRKGLPVPAVLSGGF